MTDLAATKRGGAWAFLAAQPRSPSVIVPPLAVGFVAATATGLAIGFDENDDAMVGQVRAMAPLLTGFVVGLIGRGLWSWVAASAGASIGITLFTLSELDPATGLFGWLLFSLVLLAPGYALARALAFLKVMQGLGPRTRSAALRAPVRRLLRAGVLLSGGLGTTAAIAVSAVRSELGFPALVALAAIVVGSYALYRLVDRLDRGDRLAAIPFTIVFGLIAIVAAGAIAANRQPDIAWISTLISMTVVLIPILFMAFGPWLLVRIVLAQRTPTAWPAASPVGHHPSP